MPSLPPLTITIHECMIDMANKFSAYSAATHPQRGFLHMYTMCTCIQKCLDRVLPSVCRILHCLSTNLGYFLTPSPFYAAAWPGRHLWKPHPQMRKWLSAPNNALPLPILFFAFVVNMDFWAECCMKDERAPACERHPPTILLLHSRPYVKGSLQQLSHLHV